MISPDALRLVRADATKLRRPGMLVLCLGMTLGAMALFFGVLALQHASAPERHGPAGGLDHYQTAVGILAMLATVVGSVVGATAGAVDLESGVFRDLVATGRPRLALYAARFGGALVWLVPMLALAVAVPDVLGGALAGGLSGPDAGDLVAGTAAVVLAGIVSAGVGVGLATLAGSRGAVIGAMLAFQLAITPLLMDFGSLGGVRDALPFAALASVAGTVQGPLAMSVGAALGVLGAWTLAGLGLGAWRTRTREY